MIYLLLALLLYVVVFAVALDRMDREIDKEIKWSQRASKK